MHVWDFLLAVKSQYGALALAASFLAAHIYKYAQSRRGKDVKIPDWLLRMGIATGVLVACFLAWNDQYNAREQAEAKLEQLNRFHPVTATPAFEIKSDHQSGGITAGIVNMDKPGRRLIGLERQRFIAALAKSPPPKIVLFWYSVRNSEVDAYVSDLKNALTAANWRFEDAKERPLLPSQFSGIVAVVHDASNVSMPAQAILQALSDSGQNPKGEPFNLVKDNETVGLYIGYQ